MNKIFRFGKIQVLQRCSIYDHPKNRASTSFGDSSTAEERSGDVSINPQNSVYRFIIYTINFDFFLPRLTPVLHGLLQLSGFL